MDLDFVELEDWELLHSPDSNSVDETKGFEVINNDFIRSDYFGAQSIKKRVVEEICSDDGLVDEFEGSEEEGFVEKSEIDVGFDGVVENEKSEVGLIEKSELEVGFDGVGEFVIRELGAENEETDVGLVEKCELEVAFDGVEEIVAGDPGVAENAKIEVGFVEKCELELGFDGVEEIVFGNLGFAGNEQTEVGFLGQGEMVEEIVARGLGVAENEEIEVGLVGGVNESVDSRTILADSIGVEGTAEMSAGDDSNFRDAFVLGRDGEGDKDCDHVDIVSVERESGGEGEKKIIVWWKLPFEFLKYCALRISPVWTASMAAAVMGFVILGRRYYSMKRKSMSVQVKVTVDDKKISQFKSRVVRLNEAFSVVKHVPIIRHSLPAAGATPWPAMTLR